MIQVRFKPDDRPLTEQLASYARLVQNDEQSFNVIEVFARQMTELFGSLARVLDRESEHLSDEHIGWDLFLSQHVQLTDSVERQLSDFVALLREVLKAAEQDERFLRRHRDSIAQLFLEGSLRVEFLESAERGIEVEKRFVSTLSFLDDVAKRSKSLVKDLRRLHDLLEAGKRDDKTLALLESCRMRAEKLNEQCREVSVHIPGLRDMDAQSARKLGMLAQATGFSAGRT